MSTIKTILFATDFTERAEVAFQLACALARDYGAHLLICHVHLPVAVAYGELAALPEPIELQESFKDRLQRIRPSANDIAHEHVFLIGDPAAEIIRLAAEKRADLIVMGTHGRRGLGRLLMGSVAEQVVRKASCPVVTVKTPLSVATPEHGADYSESAEADTDFDLAMPRFPTSLG